MQGKASTPHTTHQESQVGPIILEMGPSAYLDTRLLVFCAPLRLLIPTQGFTVQHPTAALNSKHLCQGP